METIHILLRNDVVMDHAEEMADCDFERLSIRTRAGFQDPLLAQIAHSLWHELDKPSSVGNLYAQTAAQMIAVHLLRHYSAPILAIPDVQTGLRFKQLRRVQDYVETHLADSLSLVELAAVAGFSEYHFARLFRQATGQSPHQYVLQKRVERAQNLLSRTNKSIAEIAIETGFTHQSHMTHVFKRYVGLTPKAFRQS